jgi:signal transduction histidine kinase
MADNSDLPPKVLVVDDNEQNRLLAQAALEGEGIEAKLASSGEEGVALFEREKPDCVLLDVRMPGMDGFAACAKIRALPGGPETPIVFLTALRDVDTFERALAAGADDFLTKPVRPTELIVRVQTALKLKRLGHELREHYELIRRQRDDMMRLQLQKERLMSFVVHDLKNPVNTMDLHAQLLVRDKQLSESARESASSIRAEARHLMRLITNLLDISKSEEGLLTAHPIVTDWPKLVAEVIEQFGVAAQARGVKLVTETSVKSVRLDPDLMRRVLENLLENAIRHAPTGSRVSVATRRAGNELEIDVADQGTGVPEALRDRIFDRFVQVDVGGSPRSSRGLGLTFCRAAVETHGGKIAVEDGNPGAVFRMRLPYVE